MELPIEPTKNKKKFKKRSNKNTRRHLERLAKSKSISYKDAILHFYKVKKLSHLDKNLLYSLYKNKEKNI